MNSKRIILLILFATILAYWPAAYCPFTLLDDNLYVTENFHVHSGLKWANIHWAFTDTSEGYWIPLTWISLMIDCQIYGTNPAGLHATNVLFHLLNTLLLFLIVRKFDVCIYKSAFVAALFALHPLNVESVAWITERKNVLSAFFTFLAMLYYFSYTENPSKKNYFVVLFFFTLALMSKPPLIITLPCLLVLLDYWPLKRFSSINKSFYNSIIEKIPLFILTIIFCVLTYQTQKVSITTDVPFFSRFQNAFISYASYIQNMLWPHSLAVYYPLIENISLVQSSLSLLLVLVISYIAFVKRLIAPYFIIGWLWFLGTLVPVIGIVQSGSQRMADRFTYFPLIGLFIIVSWGLFDLCKKFSNKSYIFYFVGLLISFYLGVCTFYQVSLWKSNEALFKHTLKVTKNNVFIGHNLGMIYQQQERWKEAIAQYNKVLKLTKYDKTYNNLAGIYEKLGAPKKAEFYYKQSIKVNPFYDTAHYNFAVYFHKQGQVKKALWLYQKTVEINPRESRAYNNMGIIFEQKGKLSQAMWYYQKALEVNPFLSQGHKNLKRVREKMSK